MTVSMYLAANNHGRIWLSLLSVLFVGGCGVSGDTVQATTAPNVQITVTGASTIAPLMTEIGKRFEKSNANVRVDVQTGGSSRGVSDSRSGLADVGMVSRDLKPDESDLQRFLLARDGVCLIVHADNPVQSLNDDQIVAIYTGRTKNWKDVGGADAAITVVNKAEGRSTLEVFTTYFQLKVKDIQADVIIGDNEQGVKSVAGNPRAIAYVSIGTAEFDRENGIPIRLLPLAGVEASVANVASGTFPMSRTLNLVTKSAPAGAVKELIEFATSPAAHDLIKELSFVPIN